jgi:hypothetical protein
MSDAAVEQAEAVIIDLSRRLTTPHEGECLYCYVVRMLDEHGCDTTVRWARRFRDVLAPRATRLEHRLGGMGGFCDCEIFMNGVTLVDHLLVRDVARHEDDADEDEEDELWGDDAVWPQPRPECGGVRTGSTQGCENWVRRSRW